VDQFIKEQNAYCSYLVCHFNTDVTTLCFLCVLKYGSIIVVTGEYN